MSDVDYGRPPHLPPGKMKTAHDIDSMIDYFTARGGCESDISILRWVLGTHKSEWEVKYDEAVAEFQVASAEGIRIIAQQRDTIAIQDAEIRRLKSEPDHK